MAYSDNIECWSKDTLEQRLRFERVLSCSSTSVVSSYTDLRKGKSVVLKSYVSKEGVPQPQQEETRQRRALSVLSGPSYYRTDESYFEKEVALLGLLRGSQIVPPIIGYIPETLSILMEQIVEEPFSKKFLEIDRKTVEGTYTPKEKEVQNKVINLINDLEELFLRA